MSVARRTRLWVRRALLCGTLLAAAALGLPAQALAAPVDPMTQALPALLTRLQTLYADAEAAAETYNEAEDQLAKQRAKSGRLNNQLADQRVALAEAKERAGQLARQQYQDGAVSPYLNLLLSDDPQAVFSQEHILSRSAAGQAGLLEQLENGEKRMTALNQASQHALDTSEVLAGRQRTAKEKVEERLDTVEKILAGLTRTQRAELDRLEKAGVDTAQRALVDSGQLGSVSRAPSIAGGKAVGYAYEQLGKPYVWGAEGPNSYDCSGLTSQAWANAGVTIPRTSQEQWKQLPRVPLDQLRPGDLVVYFEGATHVAIYAGGGQVIQAPRPGAVVKVSPIASNPIIGAVRPDSDQNPMTSWKNPKD